MVNSMNLEQALQSASDGNFVTNEYFSDDQSMHCHRGKYYYEDGAVVPAEWLKEQNFAVNGKWRVIADKSKVDFEKLDTMHRESNGLMLISESYSDCIICK